MQAKPAAAASPHAVSPRRSSASSRLSVLGACCLVWSGGWLGCATAPPPSSGPCFTADPTDDNLARQTLDAAVIAALAEHDWVVLSRATLTDGSRQYQLHSILDEPGTLTVTPPQPPQAPATATTWRTLDPDELTITASVGLLPDEPANLQRSRSIIGSLNKRLRQLQRAGYAPLPS